jgi:hypothetical protein
MAPNGVAASMYAMVERGVGRRPGIARSIHGTVEFRFREDFAPLRMTFTRDEVWIDDVVEHEEDPDKPGLVISGSLADIVQLTAVPQIGGIPRPTHKSGRAALARIVNGKVRIEGNPLTARRLLRLLEI